MTNSETDQTSIGYKHNYYLASIFDKLSAPGTRANQEQITHEEAVQATLMSIEEYLDAADLENEHRNEIIAYATGILEGEIVSDYEAVNHLMSDDQRQLTQELDAIFDDDDMDLTSLKARVAAIETRAKSLLTGIDLDLILNACSVATNTLEYWYLSADEWVALAAIPATRSSFSWKRFGRADVRGAVSTGLSGVGATLLKFGGPVGWKGWAGLVLCGALVGSAEYVFDEVWVSTEPSPDDDGLTTLEREPEETTKDDHTTPATTEKTEDTWVRK